MGACQLICDLLGISYDDDYQKEEYDLELFDTYSSGKTAWHLCHWKCSVASLDPVPDEIY